MSGRRKIYVIEQGEYSDYSVTCAFENEDDARNAAFGDGYREMILFAPGAQPKRTTLHWWATARAGGYWDQAPFVQSDDRWDYDEVDPQAPEIYRGRPEVELTEFKDGTGIYVKGADRESTLKACSDTYAKLKAQQEGL